MQGVAVDEAAVRQWRADTRGAAKRTHLNNAGAALMPSPVVDAVTGYLARETELGGYELEHEAAGEIAGTYQALATLLNTEPRNVAVVENATVAFAQALSAFDFAPGDVIVTTENDYISNQLAYLSLAQRQGVVVERAADLPTGGVDPESVKHLLNGTRVRLLAVTWVPTNSGLVQPVEELGRIARAAGIPYLIDACQAVGQLPIDVKKLNCDYLSATGRKFLRGPRGTGFLYVSDLMLRANAYPLFVDMRGARWTDTDRFELSPDARRFENWEYSYALVAGLGAAARYALDVGIERGGGRARALAATLRGLLAEVPGCRVLDEGRELAAIVTVEVPGWAGPDVVTALRRQGINTSSTLKEHAVIDMGRKRASSVVRLSPHYYNTEAELRSAVEAIRSLGTRRG